MKPPVSSEEEAAYLEDLHERYGKYLDEDGVPFKGINPSPKYYVVPKEKPPEPQRGPKTVTVKVKPKVVKIRVKRKKAKVKVKTKKPSEVK